MKKYNLKESLIKMDRDTDFRYTLTDLYEACQLSEAKKRELVQYIDAKDPVGMNAMLCNEAGVMTENISDDIPDDEMPEDIQVEGWSPNLVDCPECGDTSFDSKKGRCTKCSYRESLDESFHEGDMVWVKPSNKSGRVVSVKGDMVEVEIQGGKDPDRRDTFYTSDLEMEKPLTESDEELDFSCYNLTDDQIDQVKFIRNNLNTPAGYQAYYNLMKEVTDEGGCMDIFYDLSADFYWDHRFNVAITKLALADNRPDLADPDFLPGGIYADYMEHDNYKNVLSEDVNTQNLEATLRAAAETKLAEMGYEGDFIDEYFGIKTEDTDDNRIKVTVWGELSYEESSELADVLNHIVAEEDPDAYFDHETSGRMAAYIRKDQSEDIPDEALVAEWSEKFNSCTTWEQLKDVYGEFYNIRDDLNNGTHRALYDIIDKKIDELTPVKEALTEAVDEDTAICWYNDSGAADDEAIEYCPENPDLWTVDDPRFVKRAIEWYMNSPYYKGALTEDTQIGKRVKQKYANPYNVGEIIDSKYDEKEGHMVQVKWDYSDGADVEWVHIDDISDYNEEDEKAGLYENAEETPAAIYSMLDASDSYVDNDDYPEGASEEEIIKIAEANPECMKVTKWVDGMEGPDEVIWERPVDIWFVSKYEGGAEYEHAEGGYYYETLTHVDKETFDSKEAAQKRLAELADEARKEGEDVVAQTDDFFRIKTGRYIGDCEEYRVEAKEGAYESGKKIYEGLNEAILNEMDSPEEKPYSAVEIEKEIKSLTQNFTRKKDNLKCGFKEENDVAVKLLKKHYKNVNSEKYGQWFEITFSEPIEGLKEALNNYKVTFYMDSLDDNVMSGPSTTKMIRAGSEEEAKKKLIDSSTDKYYIPTVTKVELVESKSMTESNNDRVRHYEDMLNKCQSWEEVHDISTQIKNDPKISTDDEYNLRFEVARNFERFNESKSMNEDLSSITSLADDCGKNTFKKSARDVRFTFEDEKSASKFMNKLKEKNIHYDELPRGIIKVSKASVLDESKSINEQMIYTDVNGFLGDPGETYTMSQFRRMWQDKDSDPVMSGYDSFEEWVGETISQMDASEYHEPEVAPSGRGGASCKIWVDVNGVMGDPGDEYALTDLADYWENNRGSDPVLAQYRGDWKKWLDDTLPQMEEYIDSSLYEEALNEDIDDPKSWPDNKELTYEEALALAKAYYAQGGDGFYETADKDYFDYLVKEFGPQTVRSMKRDFGVFDSVAQDRMAEDLMTEAANRYELLIEPYARYEQTVPIKKVFNSNSLPTVLEYIAEKWMYGFDPIDFASEELNLECETKEEARRAIEDEFDKTYVQFMVDELMGQNGDGCGYIFYLKNLTTGEFVMKSDENEWNMDDEIDLFDLED